MNHERIQTAALSIIFVIVAIAVVWMWWPFFTLIAMGAILAILFSPIYENILRKTRSETWSAFITLLLILLSVIVPLYLIGQLLFNELASLYQNFRYGGRLFDQHAFVESLPGPIRIVVDNLIQDLAQRFSGFAANTFAAVTSVLSNVAGFFLSFFLVFFTVFYLLRDGNNVKKYLSSILPISESHENLLVTKLELAVNGVVKGMFLIALIQGVVATIGFFLFNIPNPFLWGAFTALVALVPTVGTSISLVPAVLYLFLTGHLGSGIGMAIWAAVPVGLVDNVIGPKLVGSRVNLHPLLVLFSVLGGIGLFGFLGVLLGPIIMAVFIALLDIYRNDLKEYLNKN